MQTKKTQDLISVIIPIYNMEKYLTRCVDTILGQTYSNMQILLVDDGSTDGSSLLCDKLASEHERITSIHIEHAGPGAARNRGIKEAAGKYVMFVDSDDWIAPQMIETMWRVMKREQADLVTCDLVRTAEKTPSFKTHALSREIKTDTYTQNEYMRIFFRIGSNEWVHYPVAKLYKRENLSEDLYPEGIFIGEDVVSTFRVLMQVQKIVHIREVYYYYFQNPQSATANFSRRDFDLLRVWEGLTRTCRKENKYYSYAKLNRERLSYTLLMRMALAVPYDEIISEYGDEFEELYNRLCRNEKMLLRAPIPLSRKVTIALMCRDYKLACAGGTLYRAGNKMVMNLRGKDRHSRKESGE